MARGLDLCSYPEKGKVDVTSSVRRTDPSDICFGQKFTEKI